MFLNKQNDTKNMHIVNNKLVGDTVMNNKQKFIRALLYLALQISCTTIFCLLLALMFSLSWVFYVGLGALVAVTFMLFENKFSKHIKIV